jgi:CBS domain containing-hemolysin-like protein
MQITPERQTLDILLGRMRDAHASICAVLDEYGVFLGIVTVEDILEEIVGEIEDESDRPTGVRLLPNGAVVCPGDTPIDDLFDYGIVLESEAETVGGLVQLELGRVPRPRDTVTTPTARLRVQSMDGNRVKRMHITPLDRTAPPR